MQRTEQAFFTKNMSCFFFSDNIATFGNYALVDWTGSGGLTLRWQANGTDEIIVNNATTQSSHIEVLLAYSNNSYTHDGGGSDPDLAAGLRWYVRTASSNSGLLSATWNQITTNVTQDNFDESDDITWPSSADLPVRLVDDADEPVPADEQPGSSEAHAAMGSIQKPPAEEAEAEERACVVM